MFFLCFLNLNLSYQKYQIVDDVFDSSNIAILNDMSLSS